MRMPVRVGSFRQGPGRAVWSRVAPACCVLACLWAVPAAAQVPVPEQRDWPWGELFYGGTYPVVLTLVNQCSTPQQIQVMAATPYISNPAGITTYTVPPGSFDVDITIQTPPPPTITMPPPDPHGVFIDLAVSPDPRFRANVVRVTHLEVPACPETCPFRQIDYNIKGHIHFDPNAPPPPPDFSGISPCRIWWETGREPADLNRDCTQEIRALASAYRQLLISGVADDPAWAWFPSLEEIMTMSAEELVAVKQRAEAQRAASAVVGDAPAEGSP